MKKTLPFATLLAASVALAGCDAQAPTAEFDDAPSQQVAQVACEEALVAPRALLIAPRQYVNVLRDLLGEGAVSEADAAADDKLEADLFERAPMTTAMLDRSLRLSDRATATLKGKVASWSGCNLTATTAPTCLRTKLGAVAKRAYKRPLASAELDAIMAVYSSAKTLAATDAEGPVLVALKAILTSPSTMYRTEFSQKGGLSAHERAAALASLLLDSVPDDALLAAADSGALLKADGLNQQIDRLLALPRVREHVTRWMLANFKVAKIFEQQKDPTAFPEFTPQLKASMYEESRRFVDDVLWSGKRPLSDLVLGRDSFVDPGLAKVYGVAYPGGATGFQRVTLPPERSGLLTQPSLLTVLARTEKTSVVARGLFVRGNLLCLSQIPAPPQSVAAQINAQLSSDMSERELAAIRAKTNPCSGCHGGFDQFGLVLESFDAIGRRSKEAAEPVDLSELGNFTGAVSSPAELAKIVGESGEFTRCLAQRTLSYALSETAGADPCVAEQLQVAMREGGGSLRALVAAVVNNPTFFQRAPQ
ncbi:MAG: DUF1592 domain-containing protein [Polyangiales bacterium]